MLVTQWTVDDYATGHWFAAFYRRLGQGIRRRRPAVTRRWSWRSATASYNRAAGTLYAP